ncbi:MAG: DNA primase [Bacteroidetes bacterium]|nr:MAG: DNA primase [Bacteroidota bacterium]
MKITPGCVQMILASAKIEEVVGDFGKLQKSGSGFSMKCPKCGKDGKGKGLIVTPAKGIFKCFSCDFGGKSPVDFLMEVKGIKYPDALRYLADKYNILIEEEPKPKGPQRKGGKKEATFRDKQLQSSGLTDADQKVTVRLDNNTEKMVDCFESGTRDQYGQITSGDDMIVWYYDLEGKAVMYQKPKSSRMEHLFRIRWQNPELHCDRNGRPMKYTSPVGSGSHLFIPEEMRAIYRDRRVIKRLFIQEGEKKAIKACKHGLPSVGIMGIQNIGHHGKLPFEFQLIVQACKVEEVVFVLDSDWDHLGQDLQPGARVDLRQYSFYWAVRNYRDYFKTFINLGIYLEIYFGYILPNEGIFNEKGIDDLLAGSLKGSEELLYKDIERCINEKEEAGKYIQIHKISTVSDSKLIEFWNLHSAESFARKYKEDLQHLPEFMIGKYKWRFGEEGKLELAQPLEDDEKFWEIQPKTDRGGNEYKLYRFHYHFAYNFLKRRGFGRIRMANRTFQLCHITGKVVEIVEPYEIKDFVVDFAKENVDREDLLEVLNMMYRAADQYLGPKSLGNLDFVEPSFEVSDKSFQYLFFRNKYWKITAEGIEEKPLSEVQHHVWSDKINNFNAALLGDDLVTVDRMDRTFIETYQQALVDQYKVYPSRLNDLTGQYDISLSKLGQESHFIQFLINTSEFFWKVPPQVRSFDERLETNLHFVSKMTAIGYLLHKYRDKSCEKAVIAMDGKLSEVGESNGRTGKSLFGFALGHVIPQAYIGAKSKDLVDDKFLFEEVSEKTDNIFLDDVRANIDFEFFFPLITGKMTVNAKGEKKFTLAEKDTPKLYLTTNHAINGASSSFKDRQALIAFSDYYNEDHKPVDDFGINMFDEWDEKQWNLFYNFMARCLQLYFKAQKLSWGSNHSGLIPPPTERLELRRLRQFIGEDFLTWADEFFGISDGDDVNEVDNNNLNRELIRQDLFNDFNEKNPTLRKYITAQRFKKKVLSWCEYRGLRFNPTSYKSGSLNPGGGDDKRNGVEYFTIANAKFFQT